MAPGSYKINWLLSTAYNPFVYTVIHCVSFVMYCDMAKIKVCMYLCRVFEILDQEK